MQDVEVTRGEIIRGDESYPYEIEKEKVRIKLPFSVDFAKLTELLKAKNYFVANPPEMDSQGWGKYYDSEGYYPYWVYLERGHHYFGFPPEEYKRSSKSRISTKLVPVLGNEAIKEFLQWLPLLKKATTEEEVPNSMHKS